MGCLTPNSPNFLYEYNSGPSFDPNRDTGLIFVQDDSSQAGRGSDLSKIDSQRRALNSPLCQIMQSFGPEELDTLDQPGINAPKPTKSKNEFESQSNQYSKLSADSMLIAREIQEKILNKHKEHFFGEQTSRLGAEQNNLFEQRQE